MMINERHEAAMAIAIINRTSKQVYDGIRLSNIDAVEYAIANKILEEGSIENNQYPIMSNGSICLKNYNYDEETKELEQLIIKLTKITVRTNCFTKRNMNVY